MLRLGRSWWSLVAAVAVTARMVRSFTTALPSNIAPFACTLETTNRAVHSCVVL